MQPLFMGMALSPDQGLGIHPLFMVQIGLGTALGQPTRDTTGVALALTHPGDVVGLV